MNEASLSFKNIILKNLSNNGFPMKRVSLPLEKLYEAADKKGANLNQILENLSTEGTMHEKSEDKIIFHAQMPQNMDSDDMMKQAQEMMGQMTPEQIAEIQKMVANMSLQEREELMSKAKDFMPK